MSKKIFPAFRSLWSSVRSMILDVRGFDTVSREKSVFAISGCYSKVLESGFITEDVIFSIFEASDKAPGGFDERKKVFCNGILKHITEVYSDQIQDMPAFTKRIFNSYVNKLFMCVFFEMTRGWMYSDFYGFRDEVISKSDKSALDFSMLTDPKDDVFKSFSSQFVKMNSSKINQDTTIDEFTGILDSHMLCLKAIRKHCVLSKRRFKNNGGGGSKISRIRNFRDFFLNGFIGKNIDGYYEELLIIVSKFRKDGVLPDRDFVFMINDDSDVEGTESGVSSGPETEADIVSLDDQVVSED